MSAEATSRLGGTHFRFPECSRRRGRSPREFGELIAEETDKWGGVSHVGNLKAE